MNPNTEPQPGATPHELTPMIYADPLSEVKIDDQTTSTNGQISQITQERIDSVRKDLSTTQEALVPKIDTPTTFKEMLNGNAGDNPLQKALKFYLKPRGNPDKVVKILEALQVDQFQKIPKFFAKLLNRIGRTQTTYTIKDSYLDSLIDYGTSKSGTNEVFHVAALMTTCIVPGIISIANGQTDPLPMMAAYAAINTYCVLAQRYSRARIEKIVNKRLARDEKINYYEYNNPLNLNLPK